MYFNHYSEVPPEIWRWKNFSPVELASNGDGSLLIVPKALDCLQYVRDRGRKALIINSAYRDPIYNAKIGGAPLSRHKYGDAFDISLRNQDLDELYGLCKEAGFRGFGFYNTFLHVDLGKPRTWGNRR